MTGDQFASLLVVIDAFSRRPELAWHAQTDPAQRDAAIANAREAFGLTNNTHEGDE